MRRLRKPSGTWRIHLASGAADGVRFHAATGQHFSQNDAFLWSLADLMTLLLVFFIMLYSNAINRSPEIPARTRPQTAAATAMAGDHVLGVFPERSLKMPVSDLTADAGQQEQTEVKERSASVEEQPIKDSPTDESIRRRMLTELADRFNEDFYVRWEDRQPVIVLGERITFNAGEAMLLFEARDTLRGVARLISRIENCQVVVTGHTDNRPIHTKAFPSNWELSTARAASVAKALIYSGVAPGQLIIQGQSQFKPLLPNTTDENRRANRRVEISLFSN